MRHPSSLPRMIFILALALAALCRPRLGIAQTQAPEADLKAAIISNMLLFVEWPAKNSSPEEQLVICYQDSSPVATALKRLDGKSIKGRTLKVAQFNTGRPNECHALYISPENAAGLGKILSLVGSFPILLAGDSADYPQRGIMLNLELDSGRIVFDIDLQATQKTGLQVSSKALRLARQVIE